MEWSDVAGRALEGADMDRETAVALIRSPDDELLPILQAAYRVRAHHGGRRVRVNVIGNAKSGACPEDCTFCSQSARAAGEIPRYPMKSVEELVAGAERAVGLGATTYCIVTSLRRPGRSDLETICRAAKMIKARFTVRICVSLGLLDEEQARALRAAGVDRYNHNLETSKAHFPKVCTTHRWDDRVATVRAAQAAGMEACCGGILGLGESREDRVDLALALRELRVLSIPVNFFDPRPGTPLADRTRPSPNDCLRGLALMRLANPQATDLRIAGGREACLGTMQPLALFAANSLFTNGYLTTGGQGLEQDLRMIREGGFEPEVLAE